MRANSSAWLLIVCAAASLVSSLKSDHLVHSGMHLDFAFQHTQADTVEDEILGDSDSNSMGKSAMPDQDVHDEDDQVMKMASEDGLDQVGQGEQMQLSGAATNTVGTDDKPDVEEDELGVVSNDMAPGSSALASAFDSKQNQLGEMRNELEASKNTVEEQAREAKRLIKEAYSKQAYLHDLQKQILEQSSSLEQQKHQLKVQTDDVAKLKSELEAKLAELDQYKTANSAHASMTTAIQTQLAELNSKRSEIEAQKKAEMTEMEKMRESIAQMKLQLDQKDQTLTKKETDMKKLFNDLNTMKKSSDRHEKFLREQEQKIKQQQEELSARMDQAKSQAHADKLETQQAIQVSADLTAPLADLPRDAEKVIGALDDLSIHDQIAKQPPVPFTLPQPRAVVMPASTVNVSVIDRTTRNIETRLDERPSTYGQKLLVGQAYSAQYDPTNDPRDPDSKCRNSRGDEIPCTIYTQAPTVPPIVPTISDLIDDYTSGPGPCVLKCLYHKGPSSSAGPKNIEELNMEIPAQSVKNSTYACPRTNNGFPFLSCSLMRDNSDQCRTQCVFDGDANPLKPRMYGVGQFNVNPNQVALNATDFRTFAHTTYVVETEQGCKSSMKADPLVACEIRL